MAKLFVWPVSRDISNEALKNIFSVAGEVLSAKIAIDGRTGKNKGHAYVEMATEEGAEAAILALNGTMQAGRAMKVKRASKPKGRRTGIRFGRHSR